MGASKNLALYFSDEDFPIYEKNKEYINGKAREVIKKEIEKIKQEGKKK